MPNAKDVDVSQLGKPKFLLSGRSGSGKTSQILTLPGKTYAVFFDPAALSTVRGFDLEYDMWVPEVVNLSTRSLKKGVGDPITHFADAHEVYANFQKDFEGKIKDNYFEDIDNIVFDSFTTFADIVMDRTLHINGRSGQWPQQDDWTTQMNTIRNLVRTLTGQMGMTLICTGHESVVQDELTHRVVNEIILTGKLKQRIPLLFSDVWHLEVQSKGQGDTAFVAQTKPDNMNPSIRTSFRDLDKIEDLTIADWNNPQKYGIGRIMRDHNLGNVKQEIEK